MDVRFVSSLTPDEEERLAPALHELLGNLLDQLPLAYTLQLQTAGGTTLQRTHAPHKTDEPHE